MNGIQVHRNTETLNIAADKRSLPDIARASDAELLGKWALYSIIRDSNAAISNNRDVAEIFARLDFERRYRDGEFDDTPTEVIPGPNKYQTPSRIYRALCIIYTGSLDYYPDDVAPLILGQLEDIKNSDEYESLSEDQRQAVELIIHAVSRNLDERGVTANNK